jgi:plasmid stability protein
LEFNMSDLLIRGIDPELKHQIEQRALAHRRSLSDEAKLLIRKGLLASAGSTQERGMGTSMMELVGPEDRGEDLVFEVPGEISAPPDFE